MTLRSRIALIRGSFWPVVFGLMLVIVVLGLGAGFDPAHVLFVVLVAGFVLMLGWRPTAIRLMQRATQQHQTRIESALDDGDMEALKRLLDEADEYYRVCVPRSERLQLRLRCTRLTAEERWSEALAVVAGIDRGTVPAAERATHDNLLAWCCAHAGETARAVELARDTVDAPADERVRPYLLGTLGAALVLDGQHAAAQAPLRDAIALGGPRWAQAVRRYYLGEALAALGRLDEARAEWQEAVTIASQSRWGRRARARLDAGAPAAYR